MQKNDFHFEEDYIIGIECDQCGYTDTDETDCCPDCGSEEIINETGHEECDCAICGAPFDMWEDGYRNEKNGKLICCDCYNNLEE